MKGFYDSIDIALLTDDSVRMAMENVDNLIEIQDDIDTNKIVKECGLEVDEDIEEFDDDDIDECIESSVDPLDIEADNIVQLKNEYGDDCDDTYGEMIDELIDGQEISDVNEDDEEDE